MVAGLRWKEFKGFYGNMKTKSDLFYLFSICFVATSNHEKGDGLKVSKSQNKFVKSSFLPKYEENILKISALAFKKWMNQKPLLYQLC